MCIPKRVTNDTILTSFDVKSLYSDIHLDFKPTTIKYWIDKYFEAT